LSKGKKVPNKSCKAEKPKSDCSVAVVNFIDFHKECFTNISDRTIHPKIISFTTSAKLGHDHAAAVEGLEVFIGSLTRHYDIGLWKFT
jgi:hypothetical protein